MPFQFIAVAGFVLNTSDAEACRSKVKQGSYSASALAIIYGSMEPGKSTFLWVYVLLLDCIVDKL